MKISCGETWNEKLVRLGSWHVWFAWRPVRVGSHDCRWLEPVERRGRYFCDGDNGEWVWEYRAAR